jgi:hypothetical protein
LVGPFERAYQQDLVQKEVKRSQPRQRQRGGGRKPTLATTDRLLVILFYFKFYPTQELLGFLFGLSQAQSNEWVHRLSPILKQALGYEKQLPARKTMEIELVLAECPGLEFIILSRKSPFPWTTSGQTAPTCLIQTQNKKAPPIRRRPNNKIQ